MNYIELINNFWKLDDSWQFSCVETRLYFYLVKTANSLGWDNSFIHGDEKTSANVGVSKGTLKTARNRLSQALLISFKEGGKGHANKTRYQILTPNYEPKPIPKSTPKPIPKSTPKPIPNPQPLLNKLNETIIYIEGEEKVLSVSLSKTLNSILENEEYLHRIYKNSFVKDLEILKTYLNKFFVILEMRGDVEKTIDDAISHFANWMIEQEQKEKQPKQKGGNNANLRNSKSKPDYSEAM